MAQRLLRKRPLHVIKIFIRDGKIIERKNISKYNYQGLITIARDFTTIQTEL
ncbi:hypothetical protein C0J52_02906 [Blattella germanica]|nr:hypothetical protein C0J52_02906 [Blattella germanica]